MYGGSTTDLLSSRSLSCPNPICFNNLMYQRHAKAAKVETAQILQIIESEQSENQMEVLRCKEEKGCLGHCTSVILFDIWFGLEHLEHGAISSGGADCIVLHRQAFLSRSLGTFRDRACQTCCLSCTLLQGAVHLGSCQIFMFPLEMVRLCYPRSR